MYSNFKLIPANKHYRTPPSAGAPVYENVVVVAKGNARLISLYAFNNSAATVYLGVYDLEVASVSGIAGNSVATDGGPTAVLSAAAPLPTNGFQTGDWVTIAGAGHAFFNGTFQITRLTNQSFSYAIPAQGSASGDSGITMTREPLVTPYPITAGSFLSIGPLPGDLFSLGIVVKAWTNAALSASAGNVMAYKVDWRDET